MELGTFTKTTYSTRQPFEPPTENKMDCLSTLGEKMYRYSSRGAIREGEDAYVEPGRGEVAGGVGGVGASVTVVASAAGNISEHHLATMDRANWAVSPIEDNAMGDGGTSTSNALMSNLQIFVPTTVVSLLGRSKSAKKERKEQERARVQEEEARARREEEGKRQDAMQRASKWASKVASSKPTSTPSWMWFAWQAWEEEHMESGVEMLLDDESHDGRGVSRLQTEANVLSTLPQRSLNRVETDTI